MRVGIYRGLRKLAVEEITELTAGRRGAVLEVKACGICGSDLHAYTHGAWIAEGVAMGHEYAARVLEVGPEARGIEPGDRVAVMPLVPCGACENCAAGRTNLCRKSAGASAGFADRAAIPVGDAGVQLFRMPDDLGYEEAAWLEPLAVSVRAVNLADPDPDEPVVVFGLGAIGQGVVQVLRTRGVKRIVAVDVSPLRLQAAAAHGAHLAIDASRNDASEAIYADLGTTSSPYHRRSGRAGAVFECSGAAGPIAAALDVVRPGGTVLFVALAGHPVAFDLDKAVQKELRVQGSFAYRPKDTEEAFRLLATREVDVRTLVTQQFPLDRLTEAFEQQLDCRSAIKVVVTPGGDGG